MDFLLHIAHGRGSDLVGLTDQPRAAADPRSWQVALYDPFLAGLPISGLSISVVGRSRRESTICASDPIAVRIDELQFALGEGPHWEATRTGVPSMVPDVGRADHSVWPMFADALVELSVGAVFAFPLTLGAEVVGVADLYRTTPGPLNAAQVATAQALAASSAAPAVRRATQVADRDLPISVGNAPEMRREVHQATGMILAQLDLTATEAFVRLKAHAFTTGRPIHWVAHEVVARRIDFRLIPE